MRVIQVPMDEKLLRAVNRRAKKCQCNRAAFIREACQQYLERHDEEERDRKYVEGHRAQRKARRLVRQGKGSRPSCGLGRIGNEAR